MKTYIISDGRNWNQVRESGYVLTIRDLRQRMAQENGRKYIFRSADLIIDTYQGIVVKGSRKILLRNMECLLLSAFLCCPGITLQRTVLLDLLSGISDRPLMDNTLSVHLARLRKSLRQMSSDNYIDTHNMFGYIWTYPVWKMERSEAQDEDLRSLARKKKRTEPTGQDELNGTENDIRSSIVISN